MASTVQRCARVSFQLRQSPSFLKLSSSQKLTRHNHHPLSSTYRALQSLSSANPNSASSTTAPMSPTSSLTYPSTEISTLNFPFLHQPVSLLSTCSRHYGLFSQVVLFLLFRELIRIFRKLSHIVPKASLSLHQFSANPV